MTSVNGLRSRSYHWLRKPTLEFLQQEEIKSGWELEFLQNLKPGLFLWH